MYKNGKTIHPRLVLVLAPPDPDNGPPLNVAKNMENNFFVAHAIGPSRI